MRNHKFGFPGLVLLNVNYPVLMEQGLDDARLAKKGSLEGDGKACTREANLFIRHPFGLFVYTADDGRQTLKVCWFSGEPWISRKVSLIYWKLHPLFAEWERTDPTLLMHMSSLAQQQESSEVFSEEQETLFSLWEGFTTFTPHGWKGKSGFGFRGTQWSYNDLNWKRWRVGKWGFWQAYVP